MQNKNFRRPAVVGRWIGDLVSLGSVISHDNAVPHHPVGESAKHNKTPVGMWWVVPLTDQEHRLLHSDRAAFEAENNGLLWAGRFDYEKHLFVAAVEEYERVVGPSPVPADVYQNIIDYHR